MRVFTVTLKSTTIILQFSMVLSALLVNIMKIRSVHQHQKVDKIVDVVYRMKVNQNYINPPPPTYSYLPLGYG